MQPPWKQSLRHTKVAGLPGDFFAIHHYVALAGLQAVPFVADGTACQLTINK